MTACNLKSLPSLPQVEIHQLNNWRTLLDNQSWLKPTFSYINLKNIGSLHHITQMKILECTIPNSEEISEGLTIKAIDAHKLRRDDATISKTDTLSVHRVMHLSMICTIVQVKLDTQNFRTASTYFQFSLKWTQCLWLGYQKSNVCHVSVERSHCSPKKKRKVHVHRTFSEKHLDDDLGI